MKIKTLSPLLLALGLSFAPNGKAQSTKPLTIDQVISLHKAGIEDGIIVAQLAKQAQAYDLGADELLKLKEAGVSSEVIKAILVSGSAAAGNQASPVPASSREIGAYVKRQADDWQEVPAEIVNWKEGGFWKSTTTAGLIKKDRNGNIVGPTSKTRLTRPITFLIVTPEGVDINEYQLLSLRENKNYREFRIMTGGVINARGGANRDVTPFVAKKVAPRQFEIVLPEGMPNGEYGFLPPGALTSASAASVGKAYTFGISE
jgi:hypothetical protein